MKSPYPPMPPISGYESPAAAVAESLAASTAAAPKELLTRSEKTAFLETGRCDEIPAWSRKLEAAATEFRLLKFGKTGQGRPLHLMVLSKDARFTPERAAESDKPVVLIQNGIHPGEISGKDASLMLIRDILVSRKFAGWLDRLTILFIPIFNVDGHERVSPFNRINQNGPAEMGFRANALRYNLNRDYVKADTPEMRAWLKMWNAWLPDFFMDNHVTDGQDHQYDVTICMSTEREIWPSVGKWVKSKFLPSVTEAMERDGHVIGPYYEPRNPFDLSEGVEAGPNMPRYSNGFTSMHHRPGLLVETHSLKSHRTQTWAHYDLMVHMLDYLAKNARTLRDLTRRADESVAGLAGDANHRFHLRGQVGAKGTPMILKGVSSDIEVSEVSGAPVIAYGTEPVDIETVFFGKLDTTAEASVPLGYVVPVEWASIVELLDLHGVKTEIVRRPMRVECEAYSFSNVSWAPVPFEGRHLAAFDTHARSERRKIPVGSIYVPMNRRTARVAMNLLEPDAADSLVRWGFFDTLFERKETFEDYVMEPIARRMLEMDEDLRDEFLGKIESDDEFATDPKARLEFFYRRSGYAEPDKDQYPILRVVRIVEN